MLPRTRTVLTALLLAVGLIMTACGGDSEGATTTVGTASTTPTAETTAAGPDESDFTPQRALPDDVPVFPGAQLVSDIPDAVPNYLYVFSTSGTNQEICEFYVSALGDLGFDMSDEGGFNDCSHPEEYYVDARKDGVTVVGVTFGGGDDEDGAGYLLSIDHDLWQDQ